MYSTSNIITILELIVSKSQVDFESLYNVTDLTLKLIISGCKY